MKTLNHPPRAARLASPSASPSFLQRIGWMGLAEVMGRASRLVTVMALAYWLTLEQFGLCSLAIVLFEIARIATQGGFSARIVSCTDTELAGMNRAVTRLNLVYNIITACLFAMLAWPLQQFLSLPGLAPLMWTLVPCFLIYPCVAVRVFNNHRQQKTRAIGLISGACVCFDNLVTALCLYLQCGIYSIAIGKSAAALLWLTCWLLTSCQFTRGPCASGTYRQLLQFSGKVITTEMLRALRLQVDVLLAALILSPAHLGLYTFAKNAGVGLSQSLMNAYTVVVLPWLAQRHRDQLPQQQTQSQLRLMTAGLALVFVVQAAAAYVYVPMLFAAQWHAATSLVAILCLSAVPRTITDTTALWYRAHGKVGNELLLTTLCTMIPGAILLLAVFSGLASTPLQLAWTTTGAALFSLCGLLSINYQNNTQPTNTNQTTQRGVQHA